MDIGGTQINYGLTEDNRFLFLSYRFKVSLQKKTNNESEHLWIKSYRAKRFRLWLEHRIEKVNGVSSKINLDRVLKTCENRGICEVEETVGEWSFDISDLPVKLRIKVVYMMLKGRFKAIPNYKIQNPEQKSPYTSISISRTAEEALNGALREFLVYWQPERYKKETKFEPVEEW